MTQQTISHHPITEEPITLQPSRVLVGWLAEQEAVCLLLGRTPGPAEDLTELRQVVARCQAAVAARPPFTAVSPIVTNGYHQTLERIAARPEVQAAFAGMNWRPAVVNLRDVLAFQKVVRMEGLDERIAPVRTDATQLLDLCLPPNRAQLPLAAFTDADSKGFTISSPNPNLRLWGGNLSMAQVGLAPGQPTIPMQAVTLFISMGTSYLHVMDYNGRYFVRDGYHRVAGLLRAGIDQAPCILIEATSFEQVTGGLSGMFGYDVLSSERPPRVADFWDDTVACAGLVPAHRKVIRVRGDEFVIQR